ncbi:MAG: polyhydroxybutyrate depolymerase [Actinomycetota bacterium]|jgi:poly(3-hydroxybutyrate) depolymerase|nr:polyhydroxybutyrate depolymerase [Actinomycetota bacterium]
MRWTRRRVVLAALGALIAGAGVAAPLAGAIDPVHDGADSRVVLSSGRAYVLHTPPLLRRLPAMAEGRPAMIVLHGVKDTTEHFESVAGFKRYSDRDGDLVAYPEGVRMSFNAGLCCGDAAEHGVDDVQFLSDVVSDLKARGAARISVVGFSNGGMMAYRLACERPDLVDTIGVFAGTLEIPHCDGPIRALHVHGLKDTAVPFDGTAYSQRLRCFLRDVRTIRGAAPGSDIVIQQLVGFPHRWTGPGDRVDATEEFWKFAGMAGPSVVPTS